MKHIALAGLVMLLAIGCNQSQPVTSQPSSSESASTPEVDVSIPDTPSEGGDAVAADEQLVSLKIPGMS